MTQNRGFSRNGAPRGYGQQRGRSPYLDNPQFQGDERSQREPMAYESGAPAAPALPTWQQGLMGAGRSQRQGEAVGRYIPPTEADAGPAFETGDFHPGIVDRANRYATGQPQPPSHSMQTAASAPQAGAAPPTVAQGSQQPPLDPRRFPDQWGRHAGHPQWGQDPNDPQAAAPPTARPVTGRTPGYTPPRPTVGNTPGGGYGTPESGYGEGGVENPAYQGPGSPNAPAPPAPGSGANFGGARITGSMQGVHGYDPNNWGSMESTKYRTAEFFRGMAEREGVPVTINNIKRWTASPEFQSMFPGVTFDGKDRLNFNGMVDPHSGATLGEVDILLQADPSNPDAELGLWWNDLVNDAQGGEGGGAGGQFGAYDAQLASTLLAALQRQTGNEGNGPNTAVSINQLLENMGLI